MKTLKDLIIDNKCRRGPADATTKRGAFWLCPGAVDRGIAIKIRRAGGDGIGQSSPDVTYSIHLRHYRSGEVRAMVERDAYHQNGSYSGGGTDWIDVSEILGATTIEEVVVALLAAGGDAGPVYSKRYSGDLTKLLSGLGLPVCAPSPDEVAV